MRPLAQLEASPPDLVSLVRRFRTWAAVAVATIFVAGFTMVSPWLPAAVSDDHLSQPLIDARATAFAAAGVPTLSEVTPENIPAAVATMSLSPTRAQELAAEVAMGETRLGWLGLRDDNADDGDT